MKRRLFLSLAGASTLTAAVPLAAWAQRRPLSESGLRGSRSALDFGVVPDIATDQSANFQTMLDTAAEQGVAVFLPGGTYVLSEVRLPPGLLLEGVPGRSRLVQAGTGPLLRAEAASSITLRGLTVDGASRPADEFEGLVDMRGAAGLTIEACSFENAGSNALYLERSSASVKENTFTRAGQFAVFSMDGAGLMIGGNMVSDCRNGGIVLHRSVPGRDASVITGNAISATGAANGGTGQWGNAINLFRADEVIIANNLISASAFSAIRGNTVRGMQVIGNNCHDSGETAIYAEFAFEDAVIANNVVDGAANGISATNLDQDGHGATISGNIIRNLRTTGPYEPDFPGFGTGIGVEADALVTGNLVDGTPLYGINAGWGPYLREVVIVSNTVRNARFGIGVSVVEGAGQALIRGNLVDARETGIQTHKWGKAAGPDLLKDPQQAPANVTVAGNLATSG